jgi:hypothetical protein
MLMLQISFGPHFYESNFACAWGFPFKGLSMFSIEMLLDERAYDKLIYVCEVNSTEER